MEVKEMRVQRLRQLLNAIEGRGKQVRLAEKIKKKPAQISQWLNGVRTIEEGTARDIERAATLPVGWLDGDDDPSAPHDPRSTAVVAELLQKAPAADRHLWIGVIRQGLQLRSEFYASDDLARYVLALDSLDNLMLAEPAPGVQKPQLNSDRY